MVGGEIFLVIALELLDEVAHEPVAKVLATKARVAGGGFDLEDALFDSKQGNIKHSMPPLYPSLPTKHISNPDLRDKYG